MGRLHVMGRKLTTKDIIQRIIEVHGDKYDLSRLVYVNRRTKVEIICKEHGSWKTTTEQLFRGQGCPQCGLITQGEKRRLPNEEFLNKCIDIHGNKYDYSKVDYQGMINKVVIGCSEHGDFEQTPSSHLNGSGCPHCGFISQMENRRLPTEDFTTRSIKIHGNKYDYSKVDYINNSTEVEIVCPKHGMFFQQPQYHMNGSGCPNCNSSKGELFISQYLKEHNIEFIEQHTFEGLKMKRNLKCDFFLPNHNVVIEYNGIQHYESREQFGGEKGLKRTQKSDKLKRDYCLENGISLLEVKYDDSDIPTTIKSFLNLKGRN